MRSTIRTPCHRPPWTRGCATQRHRRADVLGVCDSLTEAERATTVLASRGIATAQISVIMPPRPRDGRNAAGDDGMIVLLHGRRRDTERAQEILADAAARAHDGSWLVD